MSNEQGRRIQINKSIRTVDAYKLEHGCADCGYAAHPHALQFDHIDPGTKRRDLGWFDNRWELRNALRLRQFLEHVERHCQVRCANCHAIRTTAERPRFTAGEHATSVGPALF